MIRRLFLDFDGTLVDSRVRQYELFLELAGVKNLPLEQYWSEKRIGMNQREMLLKYTNFSDKEISVFKNRWMESIENPQRLLSDEMIVGVSEFLLTASKYFQLFLVTGRQYRAQLMDQMQRLNIKSYFSGILNTAQRISKAQLVRKTADLSDKDVFIGDTNDDILAGKELGLFTIGVTSGSSSSERLRKYGPNLIIPSVADLSLHILDSSI